VNIELSAENLAEIALCAAETARRFNVTPRVAVLSFSNFGSTPHPLTEKVQRAVKPGAARRSGIDDRWEMMADTAVVAGIVEETGPFSKLRGSRRAGFSGPDVSKHVLQATVVDWRSGTDRADPDGNVETGACAATWVRSGRDHEHRGDRGGGCETEVALDAELKADKRQRMRGMRMRRVLRFSILNRERGKRNWERQLRAEGRTGASLSWRETS
jgi:hypothetical protein